MPAFDPAYVLATDGASRGNPGAAGLAYAVLDEEDEVCFEGAEPIGRATNNEAEYRALIAGLEELSLATSAPVLHLSDSELVVKQLSGVYSINAENLAPLAEQVFELVDRFERVEHRHVPRTDERIVHVDALVNEALDAAGTA